MRRRTSRDIRRENRFDVLRCVYGTRGDISRQEIAAATGLSPATVATLTNELLALGVLGEAGLEDSGGGRPRRRLAVNPARGALIGIDVAETYLHVELFDLALGLLGARERYLDPGEHQPTEVADHLGAAVDGLLAECGVHRADVLGAGVSVPGRRDAPLRPLLDERLKLPLYLDNPLKASTVAELWFGAGHAAESLVVVTVGTGVGAGIAIEGSLYRGVTNSAGEWGHTCLVLDGRLCRCGGRGCVEAYVGAPGIIRTLRELDADSPLLHPRDETATIESLAAGMLRGDPLAGKVVTETSRYLGAALGNLINVVNPDTVVLGSWVMARLGEHMLPQVRAAAAQHALPQPWRAVDLRLCGLPHNPVSLGAAALALEGFLATTASLPSSTRT